MGGVFALAVILVIFISIALLIRTRNRRLDKWARSIPLTDSQQSALWELWQNFKAGRIPEVDPLTRLSPYDREYINQICSADFRPLEFGSSNTVRMSQGLSLLKRGYKPEHAAIIVGMTINRVGRRDI